MQLIHLKCLRCLYHFTSAYLWWSKACRLLEVPGLSEWVTNTQSLSLSRHNHLEPFARFWQQQTESLFSCGLRECVFWTRFETFPVSKRHIFSSCLPWKLGCLLGTRVLVAWVYVAWALLVFIFVSWCVLTCMSLKLPNNYLKQSINLWSNIWLMSINV